MSTESEIIEIERNIKEAKKIKDLGSALERLKNNRDFNAVIKQAYFKDEAVRLVHLRGDPSFQTPEKQEAIIKQMDGIGALVSFFQVIEHLTQQAVKGIDQDESMLAELRNPTGDA